ncbi:hypothetical protein NL676_035022 [Syzygium grande]|nr:hypothetical protein NL676_035022 [Syzygium grande]
MLAQKRIYRGRNSTGEIGRILLPYCFLSHRGGCAFCTFSGQSSTISVFLFFGLPKGTALPGFAARASHVSIAVAASKPIRNLITYAKILGIYDNVMTGNSASRLQWSEALASHASWWAHQRRGDCALVHSSNDYGENLFWGGGHAWRPRDAVAAWAAEGPYYDYGTNTCAPNRDCTHYTQVVWRQSLRVGCARVICVNGDTFITCNYDPHGNVIGQRPY